MARIRTERLVAATVEAAWALVTDWPAQSRWIPLTTVTVERRGQGGSGGTGGAAGSDDFASSAGSGVGTRFTGRSQLGPVGFDDPMEVVEWQPPAGAAGGRCRIRKLGPWLTGWAEIEVRPADGGALVRWTEDVRVRWLPRIADPIVGAVGSAFFALVVRRMGAELAPGRS